MSDLETFAQVVRLSASTRVPLRLAGIIVCAVAETPWPLERVLSPCREHKIVAVRRSITNRARSRGFSYPAIGQALGRDHTTIMRLVHPRESK